MMLIFLTVFLLSLGDIHGQSCGKRLRTECEPTDPPERFPENEEELARTCRFAHKMISCTANVAKTCEEEEGIKMHKEEMAAVADQLTSSIEKVCDPESQGYIKISNNLKCIGSIVPSMHGKCNGNPGAISEKRRNFTMAYAETVKDKRRNGGDMLMDCMSVIFEISCFTAVISEECGEEMFQPTLQTLMELYRFNLDPMCPDETIEEIPMFAFAFAMIEKEGQHARHELEQPMQAPFENIMNPFKRR